MDARLGEIYCYGYADVTAVALEVMWKLSLDLKNLLTT